MSELLIKEDKIASALEVLKEAETKRAFTSKERSLAVMIENQLTKAQHKVSPDKVAFLMEAAPATNTSAAANYDPVLIKMLRRALPNLIAYDIIGVQPMNMPTGLIFFQKARYSTPTGTEALKDEANTAFAGNKTPTQEGDTPANLMNSKTYTVASGMPTATAEALGDGTTAWGEMSFSIEKATVTAKSRALRADYTVEIAQDLKNVHGMEAQALLSDIMSNEILFETNREVLRKMYRVAKKGMAGTTTPGTWSVEADSQGRWFQEDAVSLIYALGKDANAINYDIRFGRGNFIIASCNLADALAAAERLDTSKVAIDDVDGAGNTYVGNVGRYKVYIDPYINEAEDSFACVGYKGATDLEAGMFYCPYVPLELYETTDAKTLQPVMGFKTRYGLIGNPYAATDDEGTENNGFYRKSRIVGL